MPSPAQIQANQANARYSTGPRTAAGKARSARNHTTHGLATGVLSIPDHEYAAFCEFEANLKQDARPQGALERETCNQLVHAAWRLRTVHQCLHALYRRLQADPLVVPEAAAELRQLTRYRATLEMSFFRAIKQLRELQTRRAARDFQLHPPERLLYPQHLEPRLFAKAASYGNRGFHLEAMGLHGDRITHRVKLDENGLPCDQLEPLYPDLTDRRQPRTRKERDRAKRFTDLE